MVHQTTGVPVGSFLSDVPLNLCLGGAADRHDKWLWPQIAQTFCLDSDRPSALHVLRYEVDTLLFSYLMYSSCLYGVEKLTCFCEVSSDRCDDFIVSHPEMTIIKFLDLSIQISLDNPLLAMHRTIIDFVLYRVHYKEREKLIPTSSPYFWKSGTPTLIDIYGSSLSMVASSSPAKPDQA